MSDVPPTPEIASRSHDGSRVHPLDWALNAGAADEIWLQTRAKVRRRNRQRMTALVGGVAALIVITVWATFPTKRGQVERTLVANTAVDGRAVVSLPEKRTLSDGSIVELKPGAELRVSFDEQYRRVVLIGGEAHFQVAKDPAKPFVVQVSGVDVRAVGTAFAVQFGHEQVEVVVTEGTVAVHRAADQSSSSAGDRAVTNESRVALVDAGNRVTVGVGTSAPPSNSTNVVALSATEIDQRLAWRAPRIELTRTPLMDVLPVVNLHSRVQLRLGDASLGQVRLSGILRADNTETLLRLLEEEHGLKAVRSGEEIVLVRAQ